MYASPERYIPQSVATRLPLLVWLVTAAGAALLVSLLVAAPVAQANGHSDLAFLIYQSFSHVCHQLPERSFFVASHQFAVCGRCTGLYLGAAIAVGLYPAIKSLRCTDTPERKWLFLATAPLAIDFGLGFLGIWANNQISRTATGGLLGAVAVLYVMPGLVELSLRWRAPFAGTAEKLRLKAVDFNTAREQISAAPSDYRFPNRRT